MTSRSRVLASTVLVAACVAVPAARAAGGVSVHCHPAGSVCHAAVSLAGGASNKHVRIVLPGGSWKHPTARPSAHDLVGAYTLSGGHFTGHTYTVTLSAVGSI